MSVYLITYDLNKEKDSAGYKPLWDEMKRLKAHRTAYSVWLVNLNNTPIQVREHFRKFLDGNDTLWLTKLRRGEYTYTNARTGTNDWLQANPPA